MRGLYLAGLLAGVAGVLVVDLRWRLFVFAEPVKALLVTAIGLVGFLLWDLAGIGLGIFFEGRNSLLVGLDVLPEVPVEEPVFLVLLCLSAMTAFRAAERIVTARAGR